MQVVNIIREDPSCVKLLVIKPELLSYLAKFEDVVGEAMKNAEIIETKDNVIFKMYKFIKNMLYLTFFRSVLYIFI